MASAFGYFLGTMEIDTDQFLVPGLSIIPDGPFLLQQPETPGFEKFDQLAEPHSILSLLQFTPAKQDLERERTGIIDFWANDTM